MKTRRLPFPDLLGRCALALLAGGCAHPAAPGPPRSPEAQAAEEARRAERLKIMQEYWRENTEEEPVSGPVAAAAPALEYPAGNYSGINFAPRLARDPSLAEPER